MKYEWRKMEKTIYGVKDRPIIVDIPAQSFIMIDGEGNPNKAMFTDQVSALYTLAYAIKMYYKKAFSDREINDFVVYPLEGIWQQKVQGNLIKDDLIYTIMIAQPNFITKEMAMEALENVKLKKPSPYYDDIRFETIAKERSVSMLHVGPFDDEPQSFAKMDDFCRKHDLKRKSIRHKEIYLNNFNRIAPDKLKTILRYPVE